MAPLYEDGSAKLHPFEAPTHRRRASWMALFEGTVPHVSTYLGFREHLTLASTCRKLYDCWPAQSGLKEMGIYLDRSSVPITTASPTRVPPPVLSLSSLPSVQRNHTLINSDNVSTTVVRGSSSNYTIWQQQQQPSRQWKSLTRLLRHWSHLQTLRFTGAISGPQEDYVQEALVTMPLALSPPKQQQQQQQRRRQQLNKPRTVLSQLQRLSFSKIGLFPYNASCIASTLLGPLGSHLLELDLSHNPLRDEGLSTIFKAIANNLSDPTVRRHRPSPPILSTSPPPPPPPHSHGLPHLSSLDLSYTDCTSVGLHVFHHALRKGGMPLLRSLLLAGNPLKDEGGLVLATILEGKKLPFLEQLDTSACGLGPQACRALLNAGRGGRDGGMGRVKVLNVGSNYVDSAGLEGLARGMREGGFGALRSLKLGLSWEGGAQVLASGWWEGNGSSSSRGSDGGGGGGGGEGEGGVGEGKEGKSACPDLKRLDLEGSSSLSGQAWYEMCVGGREGGREGGLPAGLEELNLAMCKRLGERGLIGLVLWGERLSKSCNLTSLDLSHTGLDGSCVATRQVLGDLFVIFPHLKRLNLQGNLLGREGGRALADALASPREKRTFFPLEVLDVLETGLDHGTLLALLQGLGLSCVHFRELRVGQNDLESSNWEGVMNILGGEGGEGRGMDRLRVLDLSRSVLGDVFMWRSHERPALMRMIQKVEVLKMAWCNLGHEDIAALVESFENATDARKRERGGGEAVGLTCLDLSYNPHMGEEGIRRVLHFAFSPAMGRLRTLSLVSVGLGDAFIQHLVSLLTVENIDRWGHMESIDLRGNGQISKEARVSFQGHISRLRTKLMENERWGYARRVQGMVRIASS
ncbi:leucine-rich ribonuclease inhibitor subtype [Nannochloropsis oceanica]